jgi:hypothetical protein
MSDSYEMLRHVQEQELNRKANDFIVRNNLHIIRDYTEPIFITLSDMLITYQAYPEQITKKRAYFIFLAWRRCVTRSTGLPELVKVQPFKMWLNHAYEQICGRV